MKATLNEIDTEVLGDTVLDLGPPESAASVARAEAEYVAAHNPCYVVTKVDASELVKLQALEDHGFRFLELQIGLTARIRKPQPVMKHPYVLEPVTSPGPTLDAAVAIAERALVHDRYMTDPLLGANHARLRQRTRLRKSLERRDERVFALRDGGSGEVVGFKTHRRVGSDQVFLLLGGIAPEHQQAGLGAISDSLEFEVLHREGVKRLRTNVSARNHAIMNLEIAGLGFRVMSTEVVLRKAYRPIPKARH